MDLLNTLKQQLMTLQEEAEHIDLEHFAGKPQNWFESSLFTTHSPHLADYVSEALKNLQALTQPNISQLAKTRLVNRISEQTGAITRAFINVDTRKAPTNKKQKAQAVVKQLRASSQELYQKLSDIQGYERRLLDMIEIEKRQNSPDAVNRTLALHARLGRCRQALYDIELQIVKLEQGQR